MPSNNKNNKNNDYVPYPVNGGEASAQQSDAGAEHKNKGIFGKAKELLNEVGQEIAGTAQGNSARTKKSAGCSKKAHANCSGWNCPEEHAFSSNNIEGAGEVFEHSEKFDGNNKY